MFAYAAGRPVSASDRTAVIFYNEELSRGEKNLVKILEFFGLKPLKISTALPNAQARFEQDVCAAEYCVLSSAACFARAARTESYRSVIDSAKSVFIYGFAANQESELTLRALTKVTTACIQRSSATNASVSISQDWSEFCGPMSGMRVSNVRTNDDFLFDLPAHGSHHETLMSVDDAPVFLRIFGGGSLIFAASGDICVDLSTPVSGTYFDIKDYFIGTVPLIMYLRWAFQKQIWSVTEHCASLVVDDPVLKSRYGFLVFRKVFELMEKHNFSTTIALIPWNWKRTCAKTAQLFLKRPDRYSLVVHGNDHTAGEFGSSSIEVLDRKIETALKRIDAHEGLTGIECSRVMVFPQGVFSAESISALKSHNFVAAVNTEVNPAGNGALKTEIGELWKPAIMKFDSFPIFTRRYMKHGIENFAFDLLLGKPCLIVAHHEVFKDHSQQIIEFVTALNSLACSLRWQGLGEAVRRSFGYRENNDGTISLQMFANQLVLELNRAATVHVIKRECNVESVRRVTVNNETVAWDRGPDDIRFSFEAFAGSSVEVAVHYCTATENVPIADSLSYRIKCGLRRYLSEFRDDYVCRSILLSQCLAILRRCVR